MSIEIETFAEHFFRDRYSIRIFLDIWLVGQLNRQKFHKKI